jgi:hypothetical protein
MAECFRWARRNEKSQRKAGLEIWWGERNQIALAKPCAARM